MPSQELPYDGVKPSGRNFVYLAYFDDSDTKAKNRKWQVMSALLVKDSDFRNLEIVASAIADVLFPERRDEFTEFHACELYGGYKIFEGIEQSKRFDAIHSLLRVLHDNTLSVFYGAVDLDSLKSTMYASADPVDMAFRSCAVGLDRWLSKTLNDQYTGTLNEPGAVERFMGDDVVLFIVDDSTSKSKATMQQSFRNMKASVFEDLDHDGKLYHVHDDMYFGDSKFSVGIQLADLCSYFIARHLDNDASVDGFYKIIEPRIVYSRLMPKEENHVPTAESIIGS